MFGWRDAEQGATAVDQIRWRMDSSVSGPGFGLVIGAQTKAAGYVADCDSAIVDIARNLESDVVGESSRVNGPYLSILNETLEAWGEGARAHRLDLGRYAQALIAVDEALLAAEEDAAGAMSGIASAFGSGE